MDIKFFIEKISMLFIYCCIYNIMIKFAEVKNKNIKYHFVYILLLTILFSMFNKVNNLYFSLFFKWLTCYVVYNNIDIYSSFTKKITVIIFIFFISIVGELIAVAILTQIISISTDIVFESYMKPIYDIFVGCILWICCNKKIILRFKKIIELLENKYLNLYKYILVVLIVCSCIYFYYSTRNTTMYTFFISVIFVIFSIAFLMESIKRSDYQKNYRLEVERYNELKSYIDLNLSLTGQIKKDNHEYKNNLLVMYGLLKSNNIEKCTIYLESIINEKINLVDIIDNDFKYIKEQGLKFLFIHKYMKSKGFINWVIDIQKNLLNFNFDIYKIDEIKSLYKIIGIILDNAIESSIESDDRSILIQMGIVKGNLEIVIVNSFKDKPDLKKIFLEGYSTKGNARGYGLNIVDEICKRYSSIFNIQTSLKELVFVQLITVESKY